MDTRELFEKLTRYRIEVMRAWSDGACIESAPVSDEELNNWKIDETPTWDWLHYHYRVKENTQEAFTTCRDYVTRNGDDKWIEGTAWGKIVDYIDKYLTSDEVREANWNIMKENIDRLFEQVEDLKAKNDDLVREVDRLNKDIDTMPKPTIAPYPPYIPYVGDIPQPYTYPQVWYSTIGVSGHGEGSVHPDISSRKNKR